MLTRQRFAGRGGDEATETEQAGHGHGFDAVAGSIAGLHGGLHHHADTESAARHQFAVDVESLAVPRVVLEADGVPLVRHFPADLCECRCPDGGNAQPRNDHGLQTHTVRTPERRPGNDQKENSREDAPMLEQSLLPIRSFEEFFQGLRLYQTMAEISIWRADNCRSDEA